VMTDLFGEAGAGTVLESLGGHSRSPLGPLGLQAPDNLRVARRFPHSSNDSPFRHDNLSTMCHHSLTAETERITCDAELRALNQGSRRCLQ
jgi:hypothetical protein